jgi:hypothetical protein
LNYLAKGGGSEFTSENISIPAFPEVPTTQEDQVVKALSLESRGHASSWRWEQCMFGEMAMPVAAQKALAKLQ